jgi:mannose-6-phosphate isomerase-like protein (cupin superfamily)
LQSLVVNGIYDGGAIVIVRNAWKIQKDVGRSRHGGEGAIENWHIFESEDWQSNLTIIGFDILPPGTSIAVHQHIHEEKLYFVMEGTGLMTVNGEQRRVVSGDAVPLNAGGSHGLENDSDKPLMVMVIECKMTREAKLESEKLDPRLRGAAADVVAEFERAKSQSSD